MSSQQPFSPLPNTGEVHHVQHLSDQLGKLYLSDEYSDITLVVEATRFSAHKVILAARSEYFRALLYGGMRESSQSEIELKDTPITAFRLLLKYIYTGHISLTAFKEELVLEILGLSHQYGFLDLETAVSEYLKAVLSIKSVCLIYDTAALYRLSSLSEAALVFMDRHAGEVLDHESFLSLSESSVREIICRDSFCAEEVDIFKAVARWAKSNPDNEVGAILKEIRLSLLSIQDLLKVVRPTDLMPADILLDAIQNRTECRDTDLRYRGYKMPEENIAVPRHSATVLVGEVKTALLDGDSKNYDMERGFSRHPIDETGDKGIVVKLGMPCIINRVNILLWDRDQRAYSYYIEVSMDQKDWVKVVDHSKYHCRSWQFLYFPARVVRFIRIVGTHNTVNKVFHVVTLEALYTEAIYQLDLGLIVPTSNVATLDHSALVIEGVCRSRNALLNGDTSNYDWDSGYTCHQLGSGAIMVQLGQPYALDSLRMLLWDCDDRSYSYYIEVSTNQKDWEVVCDRTREACRSWQIITFTRRPVVFVRIVGTHNTANEVFHCVHFEAPAMANLAGVRVSPGPRCSRSASRSTEESSGQEEEGEARGENNSHHSSEEEEVGRGGAQALPQQQPQQQQQQPQQQQQQLLQQHHYMQMQGLHPPAMQHHHPHPEDPFNLPLGAAALPPVMPLAGGNVQPVLPLVGGNPAMPPLAAGNMQGLAPGQIVGRGMAEGAVRRNARPPRRNASTPSSP